MSLLLSAALAAGVVAPPLRPDQSAFLHIYRELVETDTSAISGSCTLAANQLLARLRAAGFGPAQATVFVADGHPKDGGLLARIDGSDPAAKPMLLIDHIDVVAARREDWPRDPYKLVQENGYFIGRGTIDDKALSAIWIDTLIRLKKARATPRRTIKVALTCGEESGGSFNGAEWLVQHRRADIDAGFALNEGGYGITDTSGKPVALLLAVGEKRSITYALETRNLGGHSSRPRPDNAIYALADGIERIRAAPFPIRFYPTNRAYFSRMAPALGGEMGKAMTQLVANPADASAAAVVTRDAAYNATLRTTCVPTMLDAGHAPNALPQRARAIIQCRLLPGDAPADVKVHLERAIGGLAVSVELVDEGQASGPVAVPPPLDPAIIEPAESVAKEIMPGVPLIPVLLTAGTDGRYISAAGIPTYGVPGILLDPDGNGAHGVNERIRVESLFRGRDYLYALIKRYAGLR